MNEACKTLRKGRRGLSITVALALSASSVGLSPFEGAAQTREDTAGGSLETGSAHGADHAVLDLISDTEIQVDDRSGRNGSELGGATFRTDGKLYIVSAHIDPVNGEVETGIQRCAADPAEIRGHGVCDQSRDGFVAIRMGRNGVPELGVLRSRDESGISTLAFFSPEDPTWDETTWTQILQEMRSDIERYINSQRRPVT